MSTAGGSESLPALAAASARATAPVGLVERARAGDTDAFEALVARWLEPAFRIALVILGDEADARDATQEAFLAAWRGLPGLREPECFDAWLRQILTNACRRVARSRRRTAVREIHVEAIDDHGPTDLESPDERASQLDALERAWFRLSQPERAILAYHHLERRSLADIAAALGVPEGTAKSRLFSARRSLEKALEAQLR